MEEELSLADRFRQQVLVESAPVIQPGATGLTPEDFRLPVHIVDDQLLRELAHIPQRMGFKIGEVAEMLGLKPYVLRYWESEFPALRPKKAGNQQRYYTRREVEYAFIIRKLLHRDKYSIEGAKNILKSVFEVVQKKQQDIASEKKQKKEIKTLLLRHLYRLQSLEQSLNFLLDENIEAS